MKPEEKCHETLKTNTTSVPFLEVTVTYPHPCTYCPCFSCPKKAECPVCVSCPNSQKDCPRFPKPLPYYPPYYPPFGPYPWIQWHQPWGTNFTDRNAKEEDRGF